MNQHNIEQLKENLEDLDLVHLKLQGIFNVLMNTQLEAVSTENVHNIITAAEGFVEDLKGIKGILQKNVHDIELDYWINQTPVETAPVLLEWDTK